jgi:phospholipase/carboxylesterase/glyoxalase family protein
MTQTVLDHIHVYEPPAAGERRTLLLLHGTGGNEHDLIPAGGVLIPGAGLLSPRGRVLERGMPRFFRRFAEGVFDIEDLKVRTAELAAFVTNAAAHYHFDPSQVVAAGFSNGANIAASLLLLRPGILKAAALFSPMVPLVPDPLPSLAGVRVFISAGRRDPIVPPDNSERLAALLQSCGASVDLRWTPGGHSLGPEDVEAAAVWLR